MSKTLSNGTLGLRFMQNAQRAKQLKEVELQRAEVPDEGKWELSGGFGKGISQEQSTDVHEASYLPFLYSLGDEDSLENVTPSIPNLGRRFFSRHDEDKDKPPVAPTLESATTSASRKGRIRAHPRPISISTLNAGRGSSLKGFDQLIEEDDRRKKRRAQDRNDPHVLKATARQAIFEGGNVGVDLRAQASVPVTTKVFIKPAGVDDPKDVARVASSTKKEMRAESRDEIVDGAKRKNTKREREPNSGVADDEVKKPKKKKRSLDYED